MKVVCIKIINPVTRRETETSNWLSLDSDYLVLSIQGSPGRELAVRVLDDRGGVPGVWPIEMFMTISSRIPSNWVVSIGENGQFDAAPWKWLRPGFWEDYFDHDPQAIADFEEEKNKILEESESETRQR